MLVSIAGCISRHDGGESAGYRERLIQIAMPGRHSTHISKYAVVSEEKSLRPPVEQILMASPYVL